MLPIITTIHKFEANLAQLSITVEYYPAEKAKLTGHPDSWEPSTNDELHIINMVRDDNGEQVDIELSQKEYTKLHYHVFKRAQFLKEDFYAELADMKYSPELNEKF